MRAYEEMVIRRCLVGGAMPHPPGAGRAPSYGYESAGDEGLIAAGVAVAATGAARGGCGCIPPYGVAGGGRYGGAEPGRGAAGGICGG